MSAPKIIPDRPRAAPRTLVIPIPTSKLVPAAELDELLEPECEALPLPLADVAECSAELNAELALPTARPVPDALPVALLLPLAEDPSDTTYQVSKDNGFIKSEQPYLRRIDQIGEPEPELCQTQDSRS